VVGDTNTKKVDVPDLSNKEILVIGGRGFIGQALVRKLVGLKADVVSLARTNSMSARADVGARQLSADIRDRSALSSVLLGRKFDFVLNAGGYIDHSLFLEGGRDIIDAHYIGTLNLLEQVFHSDLKGFVQIGSSDEYGQVSAPQREDQREAPITPYSAAKAGLSHFIQSLARTENFPGAVVRLFLVYGPGQDYQRFLPQVIRGCLANKIFETSEGTQIRDFCYIDDVVDAILLAMISKEAHGKVINVASGEPVTIREVIGKVVSMVGGGKPDFGKIPYRAGENMALYADIKLAKQILGWQPAITLDEGLKKTIAWYRGTLKAEESV